MSKHKGSKSNQKELVKALEHSLVLARREAAAQHDEGMQFKILLALYMKETGKETLIFDSSTIKELNPEFGYSFKNIDGAVQVTLHKSVKDPPKEGAGAEALEVPGPELKDGVLVIGEPVKKDTQAEAPAEVSS